MWDKRHQFYLVHLLQKMFSCRKCQEHMISHFPNRYVPRSLPCPPPLILHCIVIYSSHHNALINGARVLHSRPLPSLSWSRLTYMSYMRRTLYEEEKWPKQFCSRKSWQIEKDRALFPAKRGRKLESEWQLLLWPWEKIQSTSTNNVFILPTG